MQPHVDGAIVDRPGLLEAFAGRRVHLIGIGGSGMNGAAAILLTMGADVSGSDQVASKGLASLVAAGARVTIGHRAELLDDDVDLVAISAAIPESNPELSAARARGIPVVKYAELVGQLMARHVKGVAIAGTHGKSTTTALCVHLCREAGLEPSFLVGATSKQLGGSSGMGTGSLFIVESCEFDRSFLKLAPESAAILNIEADHFDCYRDLDDIVAAFTEFGQNVDPDGLLVYNADDRCATRAVASAQASLQSFGFGAGADWRALNLRSDRGCYAFVVQFRGSTVVSTRLGIPGRYNVSNALAATALAYHAGADFETIADAIPTFRGVSRRLTWRGEGRGVTIIDDYAHHPTEIRVTLEAVRFRYRPKRTWVIFQPHQQSRTRHFMDEFAESFGEADEVIVPDIYDARDPGDTGKADGAQELVARIRQTGARAIYLPSLTDVADHVLRNMREGDLVLTMGAGDVWKVADELVERIC